MFFDHVEMINFLHDSGKDLRAFYGTVRLSFRNKFQLFKAYPSTLINIFAPAKRTWRA